MNFLKFRKFKKWKAILFILVAVVFFGIESLKITYAQNGFIESIATKAIGWVAGAMGYIAGYIAGAVFYIGGLLINFALDFNNAILGDGSIVHVGWPIVLSFANLGFVLAIIIIAFATIFRVQSYAMKQILWKLVVAALLVNFSLVIAGAFINIADMATEIFISKSMPEGKTDFSETLGGLFKAQQYLKADEIAVANNTLEGLKEFGGALLGFIAQNFFTAAFTFLGALTLLAIAIMLIIRYITLAILLILSPLAWLLWIFPSTQNLWQKWWSNFFRWTFFAPAVSFFLYLTVISIKNYSEYVDVLIFKGGVDAGSQMSPVLNASIIGNLVLVIGLLIGGLITANSLGIAFANTSYGWAKGVGKTFSGWVGRKGVAFGTRPLRGEWGRNITEGMQKTGLETGRVGRFMTSPIRQLGTVISGAGVRQGESLVKDAEGRLNKRFVTDKSLADSFSTLSREEQVAAVKRLTKNKTTNLMDERDLNYFIGKKDTKKIFERFGAGNVYDDFEKSAGRNTKMVNSKSSQEKESAAKEFFRGFSQKDFSAIRKNSLLSDEDKEIRIKAILETQPGGIRKVMPNFSGKDFDKFLNTMKEALPEELKISITTGLVDNNNKPIMKEKTVSRRDATKDDILSYFKESNAEVYKVLSKSFNDRLMGFEEFSSSDFSSSKES
ncbi:hypothetical protein JW698_00940 [Candidatus Wolfebacteria bacterium]|nr:hypothetical protein [Candidatus Wolfebacteria bacterium]